MLEMNNKHFDPPRGLSMLSNDLFISSIDPHSGFQTQIPQIQKNCRRDRDES